MNKILILTTVGCEACEIAKANAKIANSQAKQKIDLQVEDYHVMDKSFLKQNKITDYPTILYIVDDIIVKKAVGSYPSSVYLRWIDMYFKN